MVLNLYRRWSGHTTAQLCWHDIYGYNNSVLFQNQPTDKIVVITEWDVNVNLDDIKQNMDRRGAHTYQKFRILKGFNVTVIEM